MKISQNLGKESLTMSRWFVRVMASSENYVEICCKSFCKLLFFYRLRRLTLFLFLLSHAEFASLTGIIFYRRIALSEKLFDFSGLCGT